MFANILKKFVRYNTNVLTKHNNNKFILNYISLRYITDVDILKNLGKKQSKTSRISNYDKNAHKLIDATKKGDLNKLEYLVKIEKINIDSHDTFENTALTTAALRGDFNTFKYICDNLNPNVNSSCDCPCHRTALIYASIENIFDTHEIINGKYKIVEYLISKNVEFNALDSLCQSALDVCKKGSKIHQLLLKSGCKTGEQYKFEMNFNIPLKSTRSINVKYDKKHVELPKLLQLPSKNK